jgi:hypothetical protein
MFRIFACLGVTFRFVHATESALVALRYAAADAYLVCDPGGGCYDPEELRRVAGETADLLRLHPRERPHGGCCAGSPSGNRRFRSPGSIGNRSIRM